MSEKQKKPDEEPGEELNIGQAAAYLGISDVTLRRYLRMYGIEPYKKKFTNEKFVKKSDLDRIAKL